METQVSEKIEMLVNKLKEKFDVRQIFISGPLDILVYLEKEFNERADIRSTLEYKILLDGIKVYG